jgi:hypothetical protein
VTDAVETAGLARQIRVEQHMGDKSCKARMKRQASDRYEPLDYKTCLSKSRTHSVTSDRARVQADSWPGFPPQADEAS